MSHPWQFCAVDGCKSRSQMYPPEQGFICGKCYKRAPQWMRRMRATIGRRMGRTRDPQRKRAMEIRRGRLVDRMIEALNDTGDSENMPPAMKEQLRKDGLI